MKQTRSMAGRVQIADRAPGADVAIKEADPFAAQPARVKLPMTLDELTASIAHQVVQPLAAIVCDGEACLQWLGRDEPELDEIRTSVAAIIGCAMRSGEIIQRLRALSTEGDVQRLDLNLNDVIAETTALIEP